MSDAEWETLIEHVGKVQSDMIYFRTDHTSNWYWKWLENLDKQNEENKGEKEAK